MRLKQERKGEGIRGGGGGEEREGMRGGGLEREEKGNGRGRE